MQANGDSTLIISPTNKTVLIDGGGSEFSSYDVGKNTLFPYLLDREISKLDYVIISHFDSDHCKGLEYVLENIKVENIVLGLQYEAYENLQDILKIAEKNKINIISVKANDILKIDKYTNFEILWPGYENMISENAINNNSIVARLNYYDFSMLFTGDIEKIAEEALLKYYNSSKLNATVLKVAHHGSKSSSIDALLNVINPKIALIGVGKNNLYGHPNNDVLNRFDVLRHKGLQN